MQVGELLDNIRLYYVDRLRNVVSDIGPNPELLVLEPIYRDANGEPVREGKLGLPMRGDVFVRKDGTAQESLRVDTERMLSFSPMKFLWESKVLVNLAPFQWNWCRIEFRDVSRFGDTKPLSNWFNRWFQGQPTDENGFSGAVHFLSDPEMSSDGMVCYTDFGTAPVEAFEGLLDTAQELRASEVWIGEIH